MHQQTKRSPGARGAGGRDRGGSLQTRGTACATTCAWTTPSIWIVSEKHSSVRTEGLEIVS
jgi:hypothetical protein